MLLQCPSCEATYQLNLKAIPLGKTHIKCKKCQTSFHLPTVALAQSEEPKIAIQCDQCGTKYRVKESRLSEKTTKVKCPKCETVFEVQKSVRQENATLLGSVEAIASESQESLLSEAEKAYFEAITIDGEDSEIVPEIKLDLAETDDLFVDPTTLSLKDQQSLKAPSKPQIDSELMALSELPEPAAPPPLPNLTEDIPPIFSDSQGTEPSFESSISSSSMSNPLPIVDETATTDGVNWGRKTAILLVIMFVFAGMVGAGIYLTLKEPSLLNYLVRSPNLPVRFVGELVSKRVKNFSSRQTLFVVEGTLQNLLPTTDQMSWIRLKGLAFDESRQIVETSIVYAGNILTAEELASWSLEKIKQYYDYNNGRNNSNFELEEYQEVSFQIVFFESANILKNVIARPVSYIRRDEIVYVKSEGG